MPPSLLAPRRRGDRVRRRDFIAGLGGAAAMPLAARAQQPAMPVIGFLERQIAPSHSAPPRDRVPPGFERNRRRRGAQRGVRISLGTTVNTIACQHWRPTWLAAGVAVIADDLEHASALAATDRDRDDPDCVQYRWLIRSQAGLIASLNWPGGNVTGVTSLCVRRTRTSSDFSLMHELVPAATVIALLVNPANRTNVKYRSRDAQAAARRAGPGTPRSCRPAPNREIDMAFADVGPNGGSARLVIAPE